MSDLIQTQRLEVVDETGKVVFAAYATGKSGRLEVMDEAGHIIFSVGLTPDQQALPSSWDRMRLDVEQQHRDVAQQLQSLNALARRVQDLERQHRLRRVDQQDQDVDRRLRDLEQQSRTLDSLEREVRQLSRQIDRLERR
jgi:cell division protein FtsB